jgi:hypothetical protein
MTESRKNAYKQIVDNKTNIIITLKFMDQYAKLILQETT